MDTPRDLPPAAEPAEMSRYLPWPFEGDGFPAALGAVVQRTVLDGSLPALVVGHGSDGSWYVGDGTNDPNVPGACIATHLRHVIGRDSSIARLAGMPPGHEARRSTPGVPWTIAEVELDP